MTARTAAESGVGTPAAEVHIDEALLRRLLEEQHPDLAGEPIRFLETGWDNVMLRIGDRLIARLPRRAVAADLLRNEQAWLPKLAPHLPLPIPAPLRIGAPSGLYPWPWSILPWLEGEASDLSPPGADQGPVLAGFLRALHVQAPPEAPTSAVRGLPLVDRREPVEIRMRRLQEATSAITPGVVNAWQRALEAPLDAAPTWLQGDLHPRNGLVQDGKLTAVIDWGDMCAGDPATDLASVWTLLPDAGARRAAMDAYRASANTWDRARGWAVLFGVMLLDTGLVDTPRHAVIGQAILKRVGDGP